MASLLAMALTSRLQSAAAVDIAAGMKGYTSAVKPFFAAHCIRCHGPEMSKGKITLHSIDGDLSAGQELERWELILDMLEFGEMPPEGEPQPDKAERQAIVRWIESGLRDYVERASEVETVPTVRRLTNFEYQNTINDLLGFELDVIRNLPEDPLKPYHFNNTAHFMMIGPEQMDRYRENARQAMVSAIVDLGEPTVYRTTQTWQPGSDLTGRLQPDEIGVYHGPGDGSRSFALNGFPETGEYRIRIKAAGILPAGVEQVPMSLVMGSQLRSDAGTGNYKTVATVHLSNSVDNIQEFEFRGRIENHPRHVFNVSAKGAKPPAIYVTARNLYDNGQLNDHRASAFDSSWSFSAPRVVLRSFEFEAPVNDVWPPEHHTRILFDSPLRTSDPEAYLRDVLRRFITRAFRRPAIDAEVERFVRIFHLVEDEFDTFEGAVRETLVTVLISPQFLYHSASTDPQANRQYELASRLSYFLWGSMPDVELMALAAQRKLNDSAQIERQVLRMLDDPRSARFVENFTTQWLSIEKMHAVNINQDLFPRFLYHVHVGERRGQEQMFRPTIRDYMHQETVGFIGELIRRNATVLNIIDSDFAYLNEPLAAHYGVEGVQGLWLRPVAIKPEHHLGGLLTHGSVLIGNGTGSAPHPIYRAVWLREAILGDDVKEPPAEVPALSDSAGDAAEQAVTIKDLLARHRSVESCNDCHVRLDPWGIPFERYNAIGKYQPSVPREGTRVSGFSKSRHGDYEGYRDYLDSIDTVKVQADASVPHGPNINGMRELKEFLLDSREDDIIDNVIRRLLTYGIGRDLTYLDRFAIKQLVDQSKGSDNRFRDIIVAVCRCETFRNLPAKGE
ncbi:MAG: DUF1592 domain-containing protein [Planctomycetota bacterium]|nr:DUF1592 domain-containing protein [Planctomycetota bacterium]MDA1165423.1 DUF1592 domain-containing protein [Planctomycetota bacterium]